MSLGKGWVVVRLGNSSAARISSFIALHKLFGEVRQRSMMDLLAERIVQLGGTAEGAGLSIGMRVFHQKFGYGHFTQVDGNKLTVDFDKAGSKKVVDSFVEPV